MTPKAKQPEILPQLAALIVTAAGAVLVILAALQAAGCRA